MSPAPRRGVARVAALLLLAAVSARGAGGLSVAAAANLTFVLADLDAAFASGEPGARVNASFGSTGSLVAQIANGAPYDVFLSADVASAQRLVDAGLARAGSLAPFAAGRLVLWAAGAGPDVSSVAAAVRDPAVRRLAMANPAVAPYGRAARQALERLGLWGAAQPKLVTAEDISQAAQFVETGNADAGFVALSAVLSPRLRGRGRWSEVPPALFDPLTQAAVITQHGGSNPESARYLAFLRSEAAARILEGFGYGRPGAGR